MRPFCRKNKVHEIPRFRGGEGIVGFGGGGEGRFYFYGREDFSDSEPMMSQRTPMKVLSHAMDDDDDDDDDDRRGCATTLLGTGWGEPESRLILGLACSYWLWRSLQEQVCIFQTCLALKRAFQPGTKYVFIAFSGEKGRSLVRSLCRPWEALLNKNLAIQTCLRGWYQARFFGLIFGHSWGIGEGPGWHLVRYLCETHKALHERHVWKTLSKGCKNTWILKLRRCLSSRALEGTLEDMQAKSASHNVNKENHLKCSPGEKGHININFLLWLTSGWPWDKRLVVPGLTGPQSLCVRLETQEIYAFPSG